MESSSWERENWSEQTEPDRVELSWVCEMWMQALLARWHTVHVQYVVSVTRFQLVTTSRLLSTMKNQSKNERKNGCMNEWMNQSINQSINRSIDYPISHRPINRFVIAALWWLHFAWLITKIWRQMLTFHWFVLHVQQIYNKFNQCMFNKRQA